MRTVHAKLMEFELALQSNSIYFLIQSHLTRLTCLQIYLKKKDRCTLSTGNFRKILFYRKVSTATGQYRDVILKRIVTYCHLLICLFFLM